MSLFIDTSGFLAVLDEGDAGHVKAASAWRDVLASDEALVTTNYVVVETCALVQTRRKNPSLVDCVSFETMRLNGIADAFTLDKHFKEQGFHCVP